MQCDVIDFKNGGRKIGTTIVKVLEIRHVGSPPVPESIRVAKLETNGNMKRKRAVCWVQPRYLQHVVHMQHLPCRELTEMEMLCPYCNGMMEAQFEHNGVGEEQVSPFRCYNCNAYQIKPGYDDLSSYSVEERNKLVAKGDKTIVNIL